MDRDRSGSARRNRRDLDQIADANERHAHGRAVSPKATTATDRRRELAHNYTRSLRRFLSGPEELPLEHAHELGRQALTGGLGVLEMATIHSQAISAALNRPVAAEERERVFEKLERFFVEALAPFEMAHRGFWDANVLLRRLNDVLEGQAKRIAFALHDEAAQLLASVHLALADLASRLPAENAQELQATRGLLDQIEQRLRNLAHELRPPILDDLGLVSALEFLGESVSKRWGFPVTVEASIDCHLPPIVETTLYRVTQEALTNVAKHAQATRAHVCVLRVGHKIVCSIRDDGIGLNANVLRPGTHPRGLGLLEIQERAAALGGCLRLRRNGTRGTDLTIEIPLER
jgi:two-component system, chemotaxis family, sensor kinase Cph1